MTKDLKNSHRIRIACRDKAEHRIVKEIIESSLTQGARILRDDMFSIRVDNINRTAILDKNGEIQIGAAEALAEENDIQVVKII